MERQVGIGVTWKLVAQVAVQTLRLGTVALLARFLTPADYGAAAVAVAFAQFAPTVSDMGIGAALVQRKVADGVVRSTAFWASIAFGVGLSIIAAALSKPIADLMGEPEVAGMVAVGGLTFAVYSVGAANQAVFTREMRFRTIEVRNWLALLAGGVVAVILAALGAGAWALVAQQIVFITALVIAFWWRPGWRPTFEFSRTTFRDLASYAFRIAGGRWARLIELLVLTTMIGSLASVAELGAWTFAMSMVILPLTLIAIPIAEVLFSAFSRLRTEPERMSALWLHSIGYLAAVLLPLLLGLMIVAPDLVPLVFGERWTVSVHIVQILSVYVLIRGLQSWGNVLLDAVGRPEVTLWTQFGSLCLTPIAVVVGVHLGGVEGVAACFVAGQLIAVEIPIFTIVFRQLRLPAKAVAGSLAGVAAAAAVMAAACLAARSAMESVGVPMAGRAALTIAVGAAVYLPALWYLAPHVSRTVIAGARNRVTRFIKARRARPVLQPVVADESQ